MDVPSRTPDREGSRAIARGTTPLCPHSTNMNAKPHRLMARFRKPNALGPSWRPMTALTKIDRGMPRNWAPTRIKVLRWTDPSLGGVAGAASDMRVNGTAKRRTRRVRLTKRTSSFALGSDPGAGFRAEADDQQLP